MEFKLVLDEHMLVLCMETKHCQVVGGFDSDTAVHTGPLSLMHLNFDSVFHST